MHRARLAWLRTAAATVDTAALAAAWVAAVHLRAAVGPLVPVLHPERSLWLGLVVVPVWVATLAALGSYGSLRRKPAARILRDQGFAAAVALLATFAALFLLRLEPASRTLLVGFAAASVPVLVGSRWLDAVVLHALRRRSFDPHRVLLVGEAARVKPWLEALAANPAWGIEVVARLEPRDLPALPAHLARVQADEVYLSGTAHDPEGLRVAAELCDELGIALSLDANFLGLRAGKADLVDYDGWSLVTFSAGPRAPFEVLVKRALDVVIAGAGLVAVGPFLLALAALVTLQDGGPAFFVQERVGRHQRRFRMLKLRTMIPDAGLPEMGPGGPSPKPARDPRVTPLGVWLRRTSLDELPQLVNVLRGEMSLVGPRPPLPAEVAHYQRWQLRRLSVRPGITGSWQVSGRADLDPAAGTALDLAYIDNWSLRLDLHLLARTIPAVIRGTGAR